MAMQTTTNNDHPARRIVATKQKAFSIPGRCQMEGRTPQKRLAHGMQPSSPDPGQAVP